MKLRSSRVLKGEKGKPDSSLQNGDNDAVEETSSSGKSASVSVSESLVGKKGASEAEDIVCVVNADEDLETGHSDRKKSVFEGVNDVGNVEDEGVFLGSEVLDPAKGERVEEGNKLASLNSSDVDSGLKSETKSPHVTSVDEFRVKDSDPTSLDKDLAEGENGSEDIESGRMVEGKRTSAVVLDNSLLSNEAERNDLGTDRTLQKKEKGRRGRKKKMKRRLKKEKTNGDAEEMQVVGIAEGDNNIAKTGKRKRGRKRKNVGASECNGDEGAKKEKVNEDGVEVSVRVLRSRATTIGDGQNGSVVGLKRKRRTECLNQAVLERKLDEPKLQKKKLKRRGRPPKVPQGETVSSSMESPKKKQKRRGRPPKRLTEAMVSNENHEHVVPIKRGRGRPPKVQRKETISQGIQKNRHKDMIYKKLKRRGRGRPPKFPTGNLTTHVTKTKKLKTKNVKEGLKIHKMETRDTPQKVILEEEIDGDTTGEPSEKRNCSGGGTNRQFVRDQLVNMLTNAGWTIDLRPRQQREYMDSVYIEPNGRSHWSITRAYSMLKKKVEDGEADSNEVSAFTLIPEEAMSKLFRLMGKVRSGKNRTKSRNRKKQMFISGKASSKKKLSKNQKDGSKRNILRRFGNKSSKVKVKREGTVSRKPRLLARSSEKIVDEDNNGCSTYSVKRNLLSWMIDLGVISPGGKVQYGKCRRKKRSFEGTITNEGIQCGCCNESMGLSSFVAHAEGELSQCFDNVYVESGTTLRKCLFDSWKKEEESDTLRFSCVDVDGDDPNDDTCNICGDGGDLICCDSCPSTFHQSCLDVQNFPSGDWNCIFCLCKFCGVASVGAPQTDDSCDELISEILSCCLCEEKFHQSCLQQGDDGGIDSVRLPFCGTKCQEIFERLQTYIGVKFELEDGFSWTLLQRSDVGQDLTLHDASVKVECNSKLAVAFSVMDECFVPVIDDRSGINVIHNVIYNCGSNFRRLNYAGFFTAILERDDELISAASIRIHGYRLAEMPFIGTRHMYRRQGMCRRLLDAIESALSSIGVDELVIPAIPQLLETWTKVFGFMPIEEPKRQAMKSVNIMVFPGTDMLHKPLLKNLSAETNLSLTAVSADKAVEIISDPNDTEMPPDSSWVAKEAIDNEEMEEATVVGDGCSHLDEDVPHLETDKSTTSDDINGQCDLNFPVKDVTCPIPEATGLMSPDVPHLESDKSTTSDYAIGRCDLNFPVKDVTCQIPEPTGLTPPDAKLKIPTENVARDSDVPSSDVLKAISFVKSERLSSSESCQDSGLQRSSEPQLGAEKKNVLGVKESLSTSKIVPKNTFDLNLHPSAVDNDMHIVEDEESLPNEPRVYTKSFELSESRRWVECNLPHSRPCATTPLLLP